MICHRLKTVFVHIPKTGGQSVEHIFLKALGLSWETRAPLLLRQNRDENLGPVSLAHLFAREYLDCGHIAPLDFADYYKFAVVRNPFARLVSEYLYRYQQEMSFREFCLQRFPKPDFTDRYRHIEPQWKFIVDEDGAVMVDDVFAFENFEDSIRAALAKIGLDGENVPHVNSSKVTKKKPVASYYGPEETAFVREFYARDFEMFGYPNEPE